MKIGAQGFTIRDFVKTPADIEASLKKLHDIGYTSLQVSAFGEIEPTRLRAIADENELSIIVTHTNPDRILNETTQVIRDHQILGSNFVGIGMMPERYLGSLEGTRSFLRDFTPAAKMLKEAGMKLCYHNHFFEYQCEEGKAYLDIMAEETDPSEWSFILDVFWTQFSGRCPAKQIEMLEGRIDVIHFKDLAMNGREHRTAPVMEGNLCWDEIFDACKRTNIPYAMVEQDDTYGKDPFDELAVSYKNLVRAGMIEEE